MNTDRTKEQRCEMALTDLVDYVSFVLDRHGIDGDEAKYVIFNHAVAHLYSMRLSRSQAIAAMTQLVNDAYDYMDTRKELPC